MLVFASFEAGNPLIYNISMSNNQPKEPGIVDPLEFHAAQQDISWQEQLAKDQVKDEPTTLYVDPLEVADKDARDDAINAASIKQAHDDLMTCTGGQAVEEELGGWLIAFLGGYYLALIYAIMQTVAIFISVAVGVVNIYNLILAGLSLALTYMLAKVVHNIHKRCNPLSKLAIVSILLVTTGVMGVFSDWTTFASTVHYVVGHGLPRWTLLLMPIISAAKVIALVSLGIGSYAYFSTSKRVKRTLINKEI